MRTPITTADTTADAAAVDEAVDPHMHLEAAFAHHIAAGVAQFSYDDLLTPFQLVELLLDDNLELDGWAVDRVGYETAVQRAGLALELWLEPMREAHRAGRLTEDHVMKADWYGVDVPEPHRTRAGASFSIPMDVLETVAVTSSTLEDERRAWVLQHGDPEAVCAVRFEAECCLEYAFEQLFGDALETGSGPLLVDDFEAYLDDIHHLGLLPDWAVETLGQAAIIDIARDVLGRLDP